jgi:hypothetical protein
VCVANSDSSSVATCKSETTTKSKNEITSEKTSNTLKHTFDCVAERVCLKCVK